MSVKHIPDGYATITPAITIRGASKAIDFYTAVLGAKERYRMQDSSGAIMHAELQIGDSVVMLCDEFPEWGCLSPQSVGGTSTSLRVYLEDADAAVDRATAHGATITRPLTNEFWGDRTACFTDPFGHRWSVSTHVEDVSPEELTRRSEKFMQEKAQAG